MSGKNVFYDPGTIVLPRRRFVKGLALSGALLGMGASPERLFAAIGATAAQKTLSGGRFDLAISSVPVNFTGRKRTATAVNGSVPGPVLRWRQGDLVTLDVTNRLAETASIHWHGIILPASMDGVPDISFKGIAPGETFRYRFRVRQSGTFWYHSHSGFQEQTGLYGPLLIDPPGPEPFSYDREHVVMLSDWSDEDPTDIFATLKKMSGYYNFSERTVADMAHDIRMKGLPRAVEDRAMWNLMRMSDRDLSDVTGYTYTFLMNGHPPASGWTGLFKRGEKVRLRIINGAAMTFFDFRIPGLSMTVVAADGQNIEPVTVDEFRIGVAETYDVIVSPKADRAYTLFAQAIDRSGYARGTLTPALSQTVEVPPMDPLPVLGHQDMGMPMAGTAAMGHSMENMHHMGHSGHGMGDMEKPPARGPAGMGSDTPIVHAATEFGPHVDARVQAPRYRLDDPGVGLRDNGRRSLSYADLRNLAATADPRERTGRSSCT